MDIPLLNLDQRFLVNKAPFRDHLSWTMTKGDMTVIKDDKVYTMLQKTVFPPKFLSMHPLKDVLFNDTWFQ